MSVNFTTPSKVKCANDLNAKASLIFEYTHASASSLLVAFDDAKTKRGQKRGVLTDQEQDILRAAIIMCCSGLDAMIKQAVRDCLPLFLEKDTLVRTGFEKFIKKRLSGDPEDIEKAINSKYLSLILADKNPRQLLIEEYIKELTGDSLQSAEEILKALSALGIDSKIITSDLSKLKEIFIIRNKIIHELDIDLDAQNRKRIVRSQADLLGNSDYLLNVAKKILESIDKKLSG